MLQPRCGWPTVGRPLPYADVRAFVFSRQYLLISRRGLKCYGVTRPGALPRSCSEAEKHLYPLTPKARKPVAACGAYLPISRYNGA
jgi:hypothetical protein